MCGLNGIYAYKDAANPPDRAELLATRDAMTRRGPDGVGEWWSEDRRIALGHRRLSIIDLSDRASQPMLSQDGKVVIIFNGEIYNTPELRSELQLAGAQFRTTSDTEILLHLYRRYGTGLVTRLVGMFSFAIWDVTLDQLMLARDPYGIKPLYYTDDGGTFRFASQVKALLAGGGVSRDPEPAGIVGFHLWGHVPEPFTCYRAVRALPAGHFMIMKKFRPLPPVQYWSIGKTLGQADRLADPDMRASRIREGARESVRRHLLADVDVGVFLSAGVDSGAILGLVRDAGVARPISVTLAFAEFRGTDEDEAPLAAAVAEHYGARHIVRTVDEAEFRSDLPAIFEAMDQPSIDGVNTWFVAKAAREAGLKVALSGLGGDELLAGYPSFADLPRWRRRYGLLSRLPGSSRVARTAMKWLAPGVLASNPKAGSFLDFANTWEGAYLLRRGLFMPRELAKKLDPYLFREGMRKLAPLERIGSTLAPDPGSDGARVTALESSHYLRDQLLRDADWAGMAHSVEIRTPLVDCALLEVVAPAIHCLAPREGKRALAGAPSNRLPKGISVRSKTGFSVPVESWMSKASGQTQSSSSSNKGISSRRWSKVVLGNLMPSDTPGVSLCDAALR